jgi:hypothetical protein
VAIVAQIRQTAVTTIPASSHDVLILGYITVLHTFHDDLIVIIQDTDKNRQTANEEIQLLVL